VAKPSQKSVADIAQELFELLKAYAQQETVDPIKRLGSYLAWGALGSLLLAGGLFFLALSLLRALQTQTGTTFAGSWSWAPYGIVALVLSSVIGLAVWHITKGAQREHRGPT
jgi:hypothetical protein